MVVVLEEEKCHLKHFSDGLKVKVTFESQMIKWSYNELARAITSIFMHGFQNYLELLFSLTSSSAI